MKIRSLAIVAAAFIVIAVATPSFAMYHAGMGRFMQRDPNDTMNTPTAPRVGMAGPAAAGGFVARDPMPTQPQPGLQYADGMNLYQYVGSRPTIYVDPDGLRRQVIAFDGFGVEQGISDPFVRLHWGRPVLIDSRPSDFHYYYYTQTHEALAKAKELAKAQTEHYLPPERCYDTLMIIGFSNGGSAAETLAHALSNENIKVDLVFTADPIPDKSKHFLRHRFTKPGNVTTWVNYYQKSDSLPFLHGRKVDGAENRLLMDFDFDTVFGEGAHKNAHRFGYIVEHDDVVNRLVQELNAIEVARPDWRVK